MRTKRYTVVIAGLMPESYFLCGDEREAELDGLTANFIIIWNPVEVESDEEFHEAFTQVVNGVRELLGNPYVWVTIEEIEFYYFIKC